MDTVAGAVSMIGSMGVVMTDIACDPTGTLWGPTFDLLYRTHATTGASTDVGQHGVAGGNALVFGNDRSLYVAGYLANGPYRLDTGTASALRRAGTLRLEYARKAAIIAPCACLHPPSPPRPAWLPFCCRPAARPTAAPTRGFCRWIS